MHNIRVAANSTGVINGQFFSTQILQWLRTEVNAVAEGEPFFLILDCVSSHYSGPNSNMWKHHRMFTIWIPPGCTSHLQSVDTDFASKYKLCHQALYTNWNNELDHVPTASEKRKAFTDHVQRSIATAVVSPVAVFRRLGYLNPMEMQVRQLPNFKFLEPHTVTSAYCPKIKEPKKDDKPQQKTQMTLTAFVKKQ